MSEEARGAGKRGGEEDLMGEDMLIRIPENGASTREDCPVPTCGIMHMLDYSERHAQTAMYLPRPLVGLGLSRLQLVKFNPTAFAIG